MAESYLARARKALKRHRQGQLNPEIKVALGYAYSSHVQAAINIAELEETFEEPRLTGDEIALLLSVANAERDAIVVGDVRSPRLKHCSVWLWSRAKTERLARKRLDTHRAGEPEWDSRTGQRTRETGLGLLNVYGGGYVRLRPAGWAIVHAIEAERALKDAKAR